MQQALDALEEYSPIPLDGPWSKRHHKAIAALRERLAQPEEKYQYGTPLLDLFTREQTHD
jgi:hypothetical protein